MGDRITIREIAEKAKVSPGTVDRVLHNRGEVSPKTREKVLQIAREGNYEPNIFARHLVLNKTFSIISLMPEYQKNDYWTYPATGVNNAVAELKAFGIRNSTYFFEEENAKDFQARAQEVLAAKPDGILLAPVIYEKAIWMAEQCRQQEIPLVLIDSDLPQVHKLTSISQDAFQSGVLAGRLMHFGTGSNHGTVSATGASAVMAPQIYICTISRKEENNELIKQRRKGFYAYYNSLAERVAIKEVYFKMEEPCFEKELKKFASFLKQGDAVFVPNSKVHWLADAIEKCGKEEQLRLLGYDLTIKNVECLKKEVIDILINQKPELQGFMGIQALYKSLVLKQEVEQRVFMPLEIITKENLPYIN